MSKHKPIFLEKKVNGQILPSLAFGEGEMLKQMGINEEDCEFIVKEILRKVFGYNIGFFSFFFSFSFFFFFLFFD